MIISPTTFPTRVSACKGPHSDQFHPFLHLLQEVPYLFHVPDCSCHYLGHQEVLIFFFTIYQYSKSSFCILRVTEAFMLTFAGPSMLTALPTSPSWSQDPRFDFSFPDLIKMFTFSCYNYTFRKT